MFPTAALNSRKVAFGRIPPRRDMAGLGERQRRGSSVRPLPTCMKVRYERGALSDLAEIFAYIANDDRGAAARLIEQFEGMVGRLGANPRLGSETRRPPFRKFRIGNFLIVYEVTADAVIVHYVRHGARIRPWED